MLLSLIGVDCCFGVDIVPKGSMYGIYIYLFNSKTTQM